MPSAGVGVVAMLDAVDLVCPLLGLATERRVVVDGADVAHRCHADTPAVPVDRTTQVQLCLTPSYSRCERWAAHLARRPGVTPGRSPAADGIVSTRLVLTAQPPWRGVAGRARSSRSLVVGGAATAIVVGVTGVAVAGVLVGDPGRDGTPSEATPTAEGSRATVSPRPSATPTASPQPTATPSPTASEAAQAAESAGPTIGATPVPVVTYTVVAGDSLVTIARQFGTTVDALLAANDIDDPEQLRIGQVLVIP